METDTTRIFAHLKRLLKTYEKAPLTPGYDEEGKYDLWSRKEILISGKKRKEVYFAGLMIQKGFVGFYFMPVYAEKELASIFGKELRELLKGKSCFHITTLDAKLEKQIADALKKGYALYKERKWV